MMMTTIITITIISSHHIADIYNCLSSTIRTKAQVHDNDPESYLNLTLHNSLSRMQMYMYIQRKDGVTPRKGALPRTNRNRHGSLVLVVVGCSRSPGPRRPRGERIHSPIARLGSPYGIRSTGDTRKRRGGEITLRDGEQIESEKAGSSTLHDTLDFIFD